MHKESKYIDQIVDAPQIKTPSKQGDSLGWVIYCQNFGSIVHPFMETL